jgi:hypothetical protein
MLANGWKPHELQRLAISDAVDWCLGYMRAGKARFEVYMSAAKVASGKYTYDNKFAGRKKYSQAVRDLIDKMDTMDAQGANPALKK